MKVLNYNKGQFINFSFILSVLVFFLRTLYSSQGHEDILIFSFRGCFPFIFRSVTHLEFIFMNDMRYSQNGFYFREVIVNKPQCLTSETLLSNEGSGQLSN